MTDLDWSLPEDAVEPIVAEVEKYGLDNVETGGFLMVPINNGRETVVALAGETGIERRPFLFQISEIAIDRLFSYAEEQNFWVPVQFHSHKRGPFLSPTDAAHGFCVPGFVSAVIPSFHLPPSELSSWGWWRYGDEDWDEIDPPDVRQGSVRVVRFDEDGVTVA